MSVASGACDAACEKTLYLQRQLRESLGRDKDRIDRVWLVSDDAPVREALLPALQQALKPFYAARGMRWMNYSKLVYGWIVKNKTPHTDWSLV